MNLTLLQWIQKLLIEYWPQFLRGTGMTVALAVVGTVIGFVIGLVCGVIRTIPKNPGDGSGFSLRTVVLTIANALIGIYTEVVRGTPMMVQAVLVYYGLTEFAGIDIAALPAGFIVITLNTGAYMSEIVRGGIQSLDFGQSEAAKAIGMNHFQTMLHVVLPQTIRAILPATGNEFVLNVKDSSVLNVITVAELFYATQVVRSLYYQTYPAFLITAAIYLCLTFISSRLLRLLEKKLDGPNEYALVGDDASELFKVRTSRRVRR